MSIIARLDPHLPFVPGFLVSFLLKVVAPYIYKQVRPRIMAHVQHACAYVRLSCIWAGQPMGSFILTLTLILTLTSFGCHATGRACPGTLWSGGLILAAALCAAC